LLKNNRREEKEEVEELNPRILDRSWVVKNDNVNQQHGQTTTTSSLAPTSAVINNDPVSHSIVSTCVFQCAAGGAGLISTASWVPTIARRDEEGTRHRRRRKETGVETVEYGNITRPASTLLRNIQGKDHGGQDKHWHGNQDALLNNNRREEKEEEEELNPRIQDRSWVVKNDNMNQRHGQITTTSSLAPTSAVINNDPASRSIDSAVISNDPVSHSIDSTYLCISMCCRRRWSNFNSIMGTYNCKKRQGRH
jgi:hypothetical protein